MAAAAVWHARSTTTEPPNPEILPKSGEGGEREGGRDRRDARSPRGEKKQKRQARAGGAAKPR